MTTLKPNRFATLATLGMLLGGLAAEWRRRFPVPLYGDVPVPEMNSETSQRNKENIQATI